MAVLCEADSFQVIDAAGDVVRQRPGRRAGSSSGQATGIFRRLPGGERFQHRIGVVLLTLGCLAVLGACGGSGGSSGSPEVQAVDSLSVTPEAGGSLVIAEGDLAGVQIEVPPGVVDRPVTLKIGLVPGAPDVDASALVADNGAGIFAVVDRALAAPADGGDPQHPALSALLWLGADMRSSGPTLSLEPEGMVFDPPLVVKVPLQTFGLDGTESAEELGAALTRQGGGRQWEVVERVSLEDGMVRIEVPHFSWLRFLKRNALRLAALPAFPFVNLPEVPRMTERFAQEMLCSGIEPKLNIKRVPNGLLLLWYLMNPALPEADSLNPFLRLWSVMGLPDYYDDRPGYNATLEEWGLRNGHEEELEAWIRTQATDSVTVEKLFAQAYTLADGDWYQAILLCHNALRGHVYGSEVGNRVDQTIQGPMAPLLGHGDAAGQRYHLFGMMLWGVTHRLLPTSHGLPGDVANVVPNMVANATVLVEEGGISGDLLTEPEEAAVDFEGFRTGGEFVSLLSDRSLSDLRQDPFLGLEACGELEVSIAADTTFPLPDEPVLFTSQVQGGEGPYIYRWTFGDGGHSNLSSDTHPFGAVGDFTVQLDVEDAIGAKGSATLPIKVTLSGPPNLPVDRFKSATCEVLANAAGLPDSKYHFSGPPLLKAEVSTFPYAEHLLVAVTDNSSVAYNGSFFNFLLDYRYQINSVRTSVFHVVSGTVQDLGPNASLYNTGNVSSLTCTYHLVRETLDAGGQVVDTRTEDLSYTVTGDIPFNETENLGAAGFVHEADVCSVDTGLAAFSWTGTNPDFSIGMGDLACDGNAQITVTLMKQ